MHEVPSSVLYLQTMSSSFTKPLGLRMKQTPAIQNISQVQPGLLVLLETLYKPPCIPLG